MKKRDFSLLADIIPDGAFNVTVQDAQIPQKYPDTNKNYNLLNYKDNIYSFLEKQIKFAYS
jgi:hypothetical protein